MDEQVKAYIEKYPEEIYRQFILLRQLIWESVPAAPIETMWARLPSYYAGDAFVRLIPFKDHINIEASAIDQYRDMLTGYKLTPKGMLQIYAGQALPEDLLRSIFAQTLKN